MQLVSFGGRWQVLWTLQAFRLKVKCWHDNHGQLYPWVSRVRDQRLYRTQIIWVCSDIWVFSVLDNRLLADKLSHLPKVSIWIRKGQIYSYPPWWNTKAFETVNSFLWNRIVKCIVFCKIRCGRDYALFLPLQAVINQICAFVAKRDISRICAFLGLFTQIWLRQMSFDSDLTQISGPKNGGLVLWF